jgi:hypothetical protein
LFIDERRKIAEFLLESTLPRYLEIYERIYEENREHLHFLQSINAPTPPPLKAAAEFALNSRISQAVTKLLIGEIGVEDIEELSLRVRVEESKLGCEVNWEGLKKALEKLVKKNMESMFEDYETRKAEDALRIIEFGERINLNLDIWGIQNLFWELIGKKALLKDESDSIFRLGEKLRFSRNTIEFQFIINA